LNTSSIRPPRASHPARLRSATLGPGYRDRLLAKASPICGKRHEALRHSDHHIAIAALDALAEESTIDRTLVAEAIRRYGVDAERAAP
jgi:hypothetical protein